MCLGKEIGRVIHRFCSVILAHLNLNDGLGRDRAAPSHLWGKNLNNNLCMLDLTDCSHSLFWIFQIIFSLSEAHVLFLILCSPIHLVISELIHP